MRSVRDVRSVRGLLRLLRVVRLVRLLGLVRLVRLARLLGVVGVVRAVGVMRVVRVLSFHDDHHGRLGGDLLSSLLALLADADADANDDENKDAADDDARDEATATARPGGLPCRCRRRLLNSGRRLGVQVFGDAVGVVQGHGQGPQGASFVFLSREAPEGVDHILFAGERDRSRVLGSLAGTHLLDAAFRRGRLDARDRSRGAVDDHFGDGVALLDVGRRAVNVLFLVLRHVAVINHLDLLRDLAVGPDAKGGANTQDALFVEAGLHLDEHVLARDALALALVLRGREVFA